MSAFGPIMLLIWPIVVGVFFSRMSRDAAVIWSIFAGYLLLPPLIAITPPFLPGLDKVLIPAIAAGIFAVIAGKDEEPIEPISMPTSLRLLLFMMLISPVLTAMANSDALSEGAAFRPGETLTHSLSVMVGVFARMLPFLLAYHLLSTPRGAKLLALALVTGMLLYSIPMWIEMRLSPQMNIWVYGFFQHDFVQTMRYGGFRPIVFLPHPLWVAFLTLSALLCALAQLRALRTKKWYLRTAYLTLLLVSCKSMGVLLHLVIAAPFIWLARTRVAISVAFLIGIAAFAYPLIRAQPWMPVEEIVHAATETQAERGQSLEFRLNNEQLLLERALERPWFGWGGWGRSQVVDPVSARFVTIIDGEWIRAFGEAGLFGYLAEFGLLLLPLAMIRRAWPKEGDPKPGQEEMSLVALVLILALNMVDLIPNATITPITWLIAGTVAGSAVRMRQGRFFRKENANMMREIPLTPGLKPVL